MLYTTQLPLFEQEIRAVRFFDEETGKQLYPFRVQGQAVSDWDICHAGKFSYWDTEKRMMVFTPSPVWVAFWKDDKTPEGELKSSINGIPAREKRIRAERLAQQRKEAEEWFKANPIQPPKKKRKPYKWSKEALSRNRKKRFRKRLEKKYGYNPDLPKFFDDETLLAIELECLEEFDKYPKFYSGEEPFSFYAQTIPDFLKEANNVKTDV